MRATKRRQRIISARLLLVDALTKPQSVVEAMTIDQWDRVVRMARRAGLLGRMGMQMEWLGLYPNLPEKVVDHLVAAKAVAETRKRRALWELNRLQRVLTGVDAEVIVLKGGGYLLCDLPVSRGRLVSDVDILVAIENLARVERCLVESGWKSRDMADYDELYYRKWMHEVPPLRHRDRLIEVDLHHNILPLTGLIRSDASLLIDNSRTVEGSRFKVLDPFDTVLHSAAHLFFGTELNGDLRDLVDLDDLLSYFSSREDRFWQKLEGRAIELGLQRSLFYALRYCDRILETPIPDRVLTNSTRHGPPAGILWLMDCLVPVAIMPDDPDFASPGTALARWFLYIRSHFLKMPLRLLIPHLLRKFLTRYLWAPFAKGFI